MQRNFGHRPRVSRRDPIESLAPGWLARDVALAAARVREWKRPTAAIQWPSFVAIAIVGYVAILVTMLMVLA